MRALLGLAVVLAVAGCDKKSRRAASPSPSARAAADAALSPAAPFLLLAGHQATDAQARYLPVEIPDGVVKLRAELTAAALPVPGWDGHFHGVAAHHRGVWAVAEKSGAGHRVVVQRFDLAGSLAVIELGNVEPVALHLTEDGVLVGATEGRLLYARLVTGPAQILVERKDARKAYDLFARAGDRVLAIDDVVRPLFADWLQIGGGATPRRVGDWAMPGLINGIYTHAALIATADGHALYVVAPYGIMDGWGHELARMPIRGDKLDMPPDLILNSGGGPAVEEHVSRRTSQPEKLVAGTEFTDFTGLAVDAAAGKVLVAAQARGLFVFPLDLGGGKAAVLPTKGPCHDVVVADGRVFVLVEEAGKGVLLVVGWDGGQAAVRSRHDLPAVYQRFVR